MDTVIGIRTGGTGKTDTVRITPGQQPGTRSTADRLSGKEMGETDTLGGHLVDIRRRIAVRPVKGEVTIADIVQVYDDKVRIIRRLRTQRQAA